MSSTPENLVITPIDAPGLIASLSSLSKTGKIKSEQSGFIFAEIDNAFIDKSFPLLQMEGIRKPNMGAHISLAYPEEQVALKDNPINFINDFIITDVFSTVLDNKKYYALKVASLEIKKFRENLSLPEFLTLKGHSIFPHITIAVKSL
ncbi:MAG: hypothetical protein K0U23_03230 [Gammaproteobacteria bacterium]|nr:hypothetical protein [Gammaproteobacteria bacterium]